MALGGWRLALQPGCGVGVQGTAAGARHVQITSFGPQSVLHPAEGLIVQGGDFPQYHPLVCIQMLHFMAHRY
jgi:hypothetical protein